MQKIKELRCTFIHVQRVCWFFSSQFVAHTKHSRNALSSLQKKKKQAYIFVIFFFLILFYTVCADMMCMTVHSCIVHNELKMHEATPYFNKSDGHIADVHCTLMVYLFIIFFFIMLCS